MQTTEEIKRPAGSNEGEQKRPAEDASAEHEAAVKKPKLQDAAAADMGDQSKRKLIAHTYKKFTSEQLKMALNAVNNHSMSEREAQLEFGVPRSTINRKRKNKNMSSVCCPTVVDPDNEKAFVDDVLCQCPLNCSERVPPRVKDELYRMFVAMRDDNLQNDFLQNFVEARPVADRLFSTETTSDGKLLRRVHCKYRIPLAASEIFASKIDNRDSDDVGGLYIDETFSVTSGDSKKENEGAFESNSTDALKKSLNAFSCVDVCQKAFIYIFGISSSRIKVLRELLIIKVRQNHIKHMMKNEENQLEVYVAKLHLAQSSTTLANQKNTNDSIDRFMSAISDDIKLINDFFDNQLWKPEYFNQKPSM